MLVWSMDAFIRDEWNQYKLLMLCIQAEIVVSSCYRMLEEVLLFCTIYNTLCINIYTFVLLHKADTHESFMTHGGPSKKNMELSLPQLFLHVLSFLLKGQK